MFVFEIFRFEVAYSSCIHAFGACPVAQAVPKSREDAVRTDLATAAAAATQEQADGAAARAKSAAVAVAAAATAKTEAAPADGQVPEPQEIRWVWQNGKRVTA